MHRISETKLTIKHALFVAFYDLQNLAIFMLAFAQISRFLSPRCDLDLDPKLKVKNMS